MDKSVAEICNGDDQRELKIEIFDYDSTSKDDIIGEFVTNLRSLTNSFSNHSQHEVINLNKQRNKRKYKMRAWWQYLRLAHDSTLFS